MQDAVSGEPLAFANLSILTGANAGQGFAANLTGTIIFDGDDLEGQTVRVSFVGYQPQTFVYEKSGNVPDEIEQTNVYLQPLITQFEAATVETKKAGSWLLFAVAILAAGVTQNLKQ